MHSKIFQISKSPIDKEDYASPCYYYDNSDEFADYIGDEEEGEFREDCIKYLAKWLSDLFSYDGKAFVYKGKDALQEFKRKWAEAIKDLASGLTADNILSDGNINKLKALARETHLDTSFRFDIEEWNGWAGPMHDLIDYAEYNLKSGDRIYIGAVIDYHY